MDKVIPAALRENVFVYLDGLLVCSPTFEAHIDMLSLLTAGRANDKCRQEQEQDM